MDRIIKFLVIIFWIVYSSQVAAEKLQKKDGYLYIATFNVFKLGAVDLKYTSGSNSEIIPARIQNIANVLAVGDFDLIALQEVAHGKGGEAAINDLIKNLKAVHNLEYKAIHSEHIGRGLMAEMITFLYDPNEISPQALEENVLTNLIEIPGRDLVRSQWKAGNFDFTVISAHLAWGNETHRIAGYEKINDILHNPEKYSNDPDIIILGDFNRFGDSQTSVQKIKYDETKFIAPNITIFDPSFNTLKEVSKSHIMGKGVPNDNPQFISTTVAKNTFVYDAFLMTKDVDEEFDGDLFKPKYGIDFGVIVFDEKGGFGYQIGADDLSHNALKEAYSDHRPLWFRFNTSRVSDSDMTNALQKYFTTKSGKRYHLHNCPRINASAELKAWESIEQLKVELYLPCKICLD